jgi:nicotinamidase-related amidase
MRSLPANAALIVVDVQQGFHDPRWGPRNNPDAEAKIMRLMTAWRETGRPVVHVYHDSPAPTGAFRAGTPGNLPKPGFEPQGGEPSYHKSVNSSFIGTSLEADLRRAGIDTLVIVGLTTHHCVSTTTRMAGNLGFETYIVSDATATFDQAGFDGRRRPAAEVHHGALSDLSGEFATVVETEALIDAARATTARTVAAP